MKLNETAWFILYLSAQLVVGVALVIMIYVISGLPILGGVEGISDEIMAFSVFIISIIWLSVARYEQAKRENEVLFPAQMAHFMLYQSVQLAAGVVFIMAVFQLVWWSIGSSEGVPIFFVLIALIIVLSVALYQQAKRENKAFSSAQIARSMLYQSTQLAIGAALFIVSILFTIFLLRVLMAEIISYEIWYFAVLITSFFVLWAALYVLVKRQNKACSVAQAISKSGKITNVINTSAVILGCGFVFLGESLMVKEIENIEINTAVKVTDFMGGQWDVACVLTPYSKSFQEDGSEGIKNEDIKFINRKIENAEVLAGEADWYLILKNPETTSITSATFRTARIKQNAFSSDAIELFSAINFSPSRCANFKDAYFVRYKGHEDIVYFSLGVKTP